ncbi:MAG: hypothetical protein R3F61_35450 [Myxococcota bacterium]
MAEEDLEEWAGELIVPPEEPKGHELGLLGALGGTLEPGPPVDVRWARFRSVTTVGGPLFRMPPLAELESARWLLLDLVGLAHARPESESGPPRLSDGPCGPAELLPGVVPFDAGVPGVWVAGVDLAGVLAEDGTFDSSTSGDLFDIRMPVRRWDVPFDPPSDDPKILKAGNYREPDAEIVRAAHLDGEIPEVSPVAASDHHDDVFDLWSRNPAERWVTAPVPPVPPSDGPEHPADEVHPGSW